MKSSSFACVKQKQNINISDLTLYQSKNTQQQKQWNRKLHRTNYYVEEPKYKTKKLASGLNL